MDVFDILRLRQNKGWGQFHFFNSFPVPIPLFSIPNPIPLLTISSNSNFRDSNSNSGDLKSRQSQFWKWPADVLNSGGGGGGVCKDTRSQNWIGSHPSESIKKAGQTTQHYSEISLGAKI